MIKKKYVFIKEWRDKENEYIKGLTSISIQRAKNRNPKLKSLPRCYKKSAHIAILLATKLASLDMRFTNQLEKDRRIILASSIRCSIDWSGKAEWFHNGRITFITSPSQIKKLYPILIDFDIAMSLELSHGFQLSKGFSWLCSSIISVYTKITSLLWFQPTAEKKRGLSCGVTNILFYIFLTMLKTIMSKLILTNSGFGLLHEFVSCHSYQVLQK